MYLVDSNRSLDSPYLITSVLSAKKCILSLESGKTAKNSKEIKIAKLQAI